MRWFHELRESKTPGLVIFSAQEGVAALSMLDAEGNVLGYEGITHRARQQLDWFRESCDGGQCLQLIDTDDGVLNVPVNAKYCECVIFSSPEIVDNNKSRLGPGKPSETFFAPL